MVPCPVAVDRLRVSLDEAARVRDAAGEVGMVGDAGVEHRNGHAQTLYPALQATGPRSADAVIESRLADAVEPDAIDSAGGEARSARDTARHGGPGRMRGVLAHADILTADAGQSAAGRHTRGGQGGARGAAARRPVLHDERQVGPAGIVVAELEQRGDVEEAAVDPSAGHQSQRVQRDDEAVLSQFHRAKGHPAAPGRRLGHEHAARLHHHASPVMRVTTRVFGPVEVCGRDCGSRRLPRERLSGAIAPPHAKARPRTRRARRSGCRPPAGRRRSARRDVGRETRASGTRVRRRCMGPPSAHESARTPDLVQNRRALQCCVSCRRNVATDRTASTTRAL